MPLKPLNAVVTKDIITSTFLRHPSIQLLPVDVTSTKKGGILQP